jgi:hypothetical protein
MDKDGQKELLATKLYVESKVKEEGEAVSSSILLDYFLEKNSGNLPQSIFDVALFLKMAARTDLNTGTFTADNKNIWWYQKNIKDEFQGPSYNHTPKDESAINLIGKPYHSWNLVALLYYLPANVVRAGGIYRQLTNFSAQGLGKTRADLQTLSDLREIESYLLEFAQKQS